MSLVGKRTNKGFLLLEVMISVAILSVSLVLILNSFMRSVRAMEFSEDYFRAGLLLEKKLYAVCNVEIVEGSSGSTFSDFNNKFSWDLGVERLEEDSILHKVDLKVSWNQGTSEHDISILTYL